MLTALLALPWVSQAQSTLTVANGNATNGYVPVYGFYNDAYNRVQMLYTSDLLTAMVGEPINKLTYYSSSADVSWGSAVFTVKLANVTETALAAGTGISAPDTVPVYYSGSLSVVDNLMIVELDSSFTYTGGNLLVEITNVPGGYSSCSFYGNEVIGASLQGYGYSSLPAASSLNARDFMPKTTFEYGVITCPKPTNLACTTDSNQLSLTWVAGGNESQWLIYLNDSIVDLVNTNSVTITDLEANMPYTVGVRGLCDVDDTSMIVTLSVRTDCQLMQMPFFTSFENDPYGVFPPCYTRVLNYNTDPSVNTVYAHTGTQSMYLAASSSYNMFATQAVPLAGNQIKVNFWLLLNGSADYPSSLQAGVMTNPDSANSFIPLLNITDYNNAWSEYEFNTSSLNASTTYYVAFKFYGSSTYSSMSAIDDLSITQGDGCYSLMDVNIDTATLDEITLSWTPTGNAVSYDVAYNYGVKNLVTATMIGNVSGTQYTISGLSPNNAYYVWVRSICASGDTTMWRYVGLARTACEGYMNAPVFDDFSTYTSYTLPTCWSALATSGSGSYTYPYVYNTSANYHYLNFAPSYGTPNFVVMPYITLAANQMNIEVNGYADQSYSGGATTLEVGYVTDPADSTTFVSLGTLNTSVPTDFEFNTSTVPSTVDSIWIAFRALSTSSYSSSAYIYSINITQLSDCARPDWVALDTVTFENATLHWASTGADNYTVRYCTVNNVDSPLALSETTSDTTIELTGLQPSTHYYTWVRSMCDSDSSAWRVGPEFNTTCGDDFCNVDIVMHDSYGDGWNGNAINIYVNGNNLGSVTIDDGNSGNATVAICSGDSLALTWTTGSYSSETSFEVYVAGSLALPTAGGDSFTNGGLIFSQVGCPSCYPVASLNAVDSLTTHENLTVSWTAFNADASEWVVSLDGQIVNTVYDTFYTFTGLTARTGYVVGVATLCDDNDTSDFVYINASTSCEGDNCPMVINLVDSYGDGWNGNAINVYINNTLSATATIDDGFNNTYQTSMCTGDTVVLTWVTGSYPGETSFEVLHAGGSVLQDAGSMYSTGDTILTLTGCPTCNVPDVTVDNITVNGASLNWSNSGLATSWHVSVYGGSYNLDTVVSNVPVTLTNLDAATMYTVSVYSYCGSDDSSAASTVTFTSGCNAITLPWDFLPGNDPSAVTGTIPACWYTPESFDYYGTSYPLNTGTSLGMQANGSDNPNMAVTPLIPAAGNNLYVSFNAIVGSVSTGSYAQAGIITNPNNAATFIPILNMSNSANYNAQEYEFVTSNVAGISANDTVYVAFRVYATGYGYPYIELMDLHVQEIPSCQRPDSIVVSNVQTNSVTLSWENTGATSYTVTYSDGVTTAGASTQTNQIVLNNLSAATTYNFTLRAHCGSDSSLLAHGGFTTACQAVQLPYDEGFETVGVYGRPNCWTWYEQYPDYNSNLTPYVYDDSYYANSGTKSLMVNTTSAIQPFFVSPALTGAAANQLYVSFAVYGSSYVGIEAGLMTDPSDSSTYVRLIDLPSLAYNYQTFSFRTDTVSITDAVYYLAFRVKTADSYYNSVYLDDIHVQLMPDCAVDFDNVKVSNITGSDAEVSWMPGLGINTGATYDVTLLDSNNSVVNTYTNVTSPITVNGMAPESNYSVVVSLTCGGNVTAVSDTVAFRTRCNGAVVATNYSSTMTPTTGTYSPIGYSLYNYSYAQTIIDSAYMASFDGSEIQTFAFLPTAVNDASSYYDNMTIYMANIPDSISDLTSDFILPSSDIVFVKVLDSASLNWTDTEWQYHDFDSVFVWDGHSNVLFAVNREHGSWRSGAEFAAHQVTGTAMKSRYVQNDNNPYDITTVSGGSAVDYTGDLIFLACGAGCQAPAAVTANVADYQSATITWSTDADTVEYAFKAVTDATYPAATRVANTGTYAANNLTPATAYQFQVRAICDEGDVSEWAEVTFVTDSLPCFTPTDLQTTNVSYTSATLTWGASSEQNHWTLTVWNTAGSVDYDVTGNAAYTVSGLSQGNQYYAAVKAVCGNGAAESEYSDTIQFTTNNCEQVAGVTVTNITENSAVVNWEAASATSYEVDYGPVGHGQGQGTTVTVDNATTYTITGLESETGYSVYVRALCEADAPGPWSQVQEFTTLQHIGIDVADGMNVSIYPNPTSSTTTIALSGVNGDVAITVVDMNGRVVMSDSMSCEGDCVKTMEVSGLAQGAYFVRINGENVNMVKKLVVK